MNSSGVSQIRPMSRAKSPPRKIQITKEMRYLEQPKHDEILSPLFISQENHKDHQEQQSLQKPATIQQQAFTSFSNRHSKHQPKIQSGQSSPNNNLRDMIQKILKGKESSFTEKRRHISNKRDNQLQERFHVGQKFNFNNQDINYWNQNQDVPSIYLHQTNVRRFVAKDQPDLLFQPSSSVFPGVKNDQGSKVRIHVPSQAVQQTLQQPSQQEQSNNERLQRKPTKKRNSLAIPSTMQLDIDPHSLQQQQQTIIHKNKRFSDTSTLNSFEDYGGFQSRSKTPMNVISNQSIFKYPNGYKVRKNVQFNLNDSSIQTESQQYILERTDDSNNEELKPLFDFTSYNCD